MIEKKEEIIALLMDTNICVECNEKIKNLNYEIINKNDESIWKDLCDNVTSQSIWKDLCDNVTSQSVRKSK